MGPGQRSLEQVKQRISKYDAFLQSNARELAAKGANVSANFSQPQPSFLTDESSIQPDEESAL